MSIPPHFSKQQTCFSWQEGIYFPQKSCAQSSYLPGFPPRPRPQKAKILVGLIMWLRGDQGEHYPEDGRERVKKTGVAHEWEKKEMGWWPITRNTIRTGIKISKNNSLISRTPGKERLWVSCFQHNQRVSSPTWHRIAAFK